MRNGFTSNHFLDSNNKPAGGATFGVGFSIAWQNGPLGRDTERKEPNGAFVEDVIAAALDRIEWYQRTGFSCEENAQAISYLAMALSALNQRTQRRERAQIEGTHAEEPVK